MDFFKIIDTLYKDDEASIQNLLLKSTHTSKLSNPPEEVYCTGFVSSKSLLGFVSILFDTKSNLLIHQCSGSDYSHHVPRLMGLKMYLYHYRNMIYYSPFKKTSSKCNFEIEFWGSYSMEHQCFDNPLQIIYNTKSDFEEPAQLELYSSNDIKFQIKGEHRNKFDTTFLVTGTKAFEWRYPFNKHHQYHGSLDDNRLSSFFYPCTVKRRPAVNSVNRDTDEYLEMLDGDHPSWNVGTWD